MRAQVTLTPAESKKLIAKAIAGMQMVRKARTDGIVAMHPSSSTYFIAEELASQAPATPVWVCGVIVPGGACMSLEATQSVAHHPGIVKRDPEDFPNCWVVREGKLSTGTTLRELFEMMGPGDVYIKGVNAIDPDGTVGILVGSRAEGGTIGRVTAASRRKGFSLVFPAGLEKLIPIKVEQAAREALKTQYDYSMGLNCGLYPCKSGIVVTELKAVELLSGAGAIPIAAGGLGGAEGSVTLVIKGEKEQVEKAVEHIEQCKGARLPHLNTPDCADCTGTLCDFTIRARRRTGTA